MNIKALPIILGVIIIILLGILIFVPDRDSAPLPQEQTLPEHAATSTLSSYTSTKGREVRVNVAPNQLVASPLGLIGEVAGWYFEASFPVRLLDANGKLLAQGPATAQSEWMVATPVPFAISLPFTVPATATGTLVLHNDNASGLPEHDDEVRIPVRFR